MISPICIELKRRPDLQSMQTPAPAGAGLESETFRSVRRKRPEACDVSDGRNAGAVGTHARSHQSGRRVLCLPMASFRQPEGAASSVNRRFWQLTQGKPPVGTRLTWRVESQAQEQIEKLNRRPRAASPNRLAASIGIRAQLRLAILPD